MVFLSASFYCGGGGGGGLMDWKYVHFFSPSYRMFAANLNNKIMGGLNVKYGMYHWHG